MVEGSRRVFPRHPWDLAIAAVAAFAIVVIVTLAAFAIIPPAVASLDAQVSDGSTSAAIGTNGAAVVAPAGWVVVGAATEDVVVRTPDGVLAVHLRSGVGSPKTLLGTALADAEQLADAAPGPTLSETLESGGLLLHADVGERALGAIVTSGAGAEDGVEVIAIVGPGAELSRYRAALALLLEGVRP